jgi:hypothetical protein
VTVSNVLEIGHNHTLRRIVNADGSLYGYVDEHLRPDNGEPCSGSVCVNPGPDDVTYDRATWTLESDSPLTLSPSLLCTQCGDHGWVRDGRWVPA